MSENTNEAMEEKISMTPGEMLGKARTAKNISIDAVAMELLVSKERVIELENDDYSKIAAPVYARGYLRAYAHFLQIPEDEVLESFANMDWYRENKKEDFVLLHPIGEAKETKNKHNATWLIYVFAAILVVVFAVVLQKHSAAMDAGKSSDANGANNETVEQKITVSPQEAATALSSTAPSSTAAATSSSAVSASADQGQPQSSNANAAAASQTQQEVQVPLLQKVESIPQPGTDASAAAKNNVSNNADSVTSDDNAQADDTKITRKSKRHTHGRAKKKVQQDDNADSDTAANDDPDQD